MIGVPGDDRGGAVELLSENDAGEAVGHGHGAERQLQHGGRSHRITVAVRPADDQGQRLGAGVALTADEIGEGLAGEGFAALVEDDDAARGAEGL